MLEILNLRGVEGKWQFDFTVSIPTGAWVSIVGVSGAGKSTFLKALMGIQPCTGGKILLDDIKDLAQEKSAERCMNYLHQTTTLFEHISIENNLLLYLHDRNLARDQKIKKIHEICNELLLDHSFLDRMPGEVSGGERARFSLACCLLRPKDILLLDEPFAALDENLRYAMNLLLRKYHLKNKLTTICVTHHQIDCELFSDYVAHIENGKINAFAKTERFIFSPDNLNSAKFLNSGTVYKNFFLLPKDLTFIKTGDSDICIEIINSHAVVSESYQYVLDLELGKIYKTLEKRKFLGQLFFNPEKVIFLNPTERNT